MPAYVVTEFAPESIAGKEHDGPGSVVVLTEADAREAVELGHLVLHDCHRLAMASSRARADARLPVD